MTRRAPHTHRLLPSSPTIFEPHEERRVAVAVAVVTAFDVIPEERILRLL